MATDSLTSESGHAQSSLVQAFNSLVSVSRALVGQLARTIMRPRSSE